MRFFRDINLPAFTAGFVAVPSCLWRKLVMLARSTPGAAVLATAGSAFWGVVAGRLAMLAQRYRRRQS
jgi:predicted benzoate:H+ symporter BenE